jgi:hypothetical protein
MTTELDFLLKYGTAATEDEVMAGTDSSEIRTPASVFASLEKRIRADERERLAAKAEHHGNPILAAQLRAEVGN